VAAQQIYRKPQPLQKVGNFGPIMGFQPNTGLTNQIIMQNTAGGRVGKRLMSNEPMQFFEKKKKSSQPSNDYNEA
jgi:hypothetical protein